MPTSILPQNQDEKELFNEISLFLADLRLEICFVHAMPRRKKGFLSPGSF